MVKVIINGRGLGGAINGIPRYIYEIVSSIDKQIGNDIKAELVVPEGTVSDISLKNIKIVSLPKAPAWDYTRAERYARKKKALYVNLGGRGTWYKNSIATIHDIRVLTFGDGKLTRNTIKTRFKFGLSYFLAVHRAAKLVTVSEFSKKEIVRYSRLDPCRVSVIGSGWDHILRTDNDDSVFEEFPEIRKKGYYLAVSSIAPHKNFDWIVKNAARYPQNQYVIVGKTDKKIWSDSTDQFKDALIYLGYQSDRRIKSLLENSKALIFPSKYEGFGLPPLEALACGTSAIVSDIEVMHEIYGGSVSYINTDDTDIDLEKLSAANESAIGEVLEKHSWKISGRKWIDLIRSIQPDRK